MDRKVTEKINVQDAMHNLEAIINLSLSEPGPIGIVQNRRIVTDPEEFPSPQVTWLSEEGNDVILEVLDATFRSIHEHLDFLWESPEMDWESEQGMRAITAMVSLSGEAARRMEKYIEARTGKPCEKIEMRPSFRAMHDFYQRHYAQEIKDNEPHVPSENALKDMTEVRLDKEYEFFCIRREDESYYYDPEILRNMEIVCDFGSAGDSFEDDPLLQVRSVLDRDAAASAWQIREACESYLAEFYKILRKLVNNDLAASLNCASMALYLAQNPHNLIQNTSGKTALQYFEDFHYFIRAALTTPEYHKLIAYPPDKSDKMAFVLLHLAHSLCSAFFHRAGGVKEEAIGLIHRSARKGEKPACEPKSVWAKLVVEDAAYRSFLQKFPSGPLLKILDLLRNDESDSRPFDPIGQGNYPMKQFQMKWKGSHTDVLHVPSPTSQSIITKAYIIDEFRGMLRFYNEQDKPRKHLMFLLQDQTSWKEAARCSALESLHKNAEFNKVFQVVSLPKNSDFYYQIGDYAEMNSAQEFMNGLIQTYKAIAPDFVEKLAAFLHENFFGKQPLLSREEREEFIEISHQFLILKRIEMENPDSISFTCKDAVDTGAAESASFYAFLKMIKNESLSKEELDMFRYLLYAPALFVRERPIDTARLIRSVNALERLNTGLSKEIEALYGPGLLKNLEIV